MDTLLNQAVTYDQRNKVLSREATTGPGDTLTADYSGLAQLLQSTTVSHGETVLGATTRYSVASFHDYDALGNRYSTSNDTDLQCKGDYKCVKTTQTSSGSTFQPGVGRLVRSVWSNGRRDTLFYDADGNVEFTRQTYDTDQSPGLEDRVSYYRTDGKLAAVDYRTHENPSGEIGGEIYRKNFVEYRYDALGRRVLAHERRYCQPENTSAQLNECHQDYMGRTVWDGERELWEIRMPGDTLRPDGSVNPYLEEDTTAVELWAGDFEGDTLDQNSYYGRVAYAYGRQIDRPLSLTRVNYADNPWSMAVGDTAGYKVWEPFTIVPLWNSQGEAYNGSFGDGNQWKLRHPSDPSADSLSVRIGWPDGWDAYARTQWGAKPRFWHGSLIQDKRDNSGLNYRRNRYYDPTKGQFTQEDPIGLAGGLNLYGFNDGDPVNLSDPFGLCPEEDRDDDGLCPGGLTVEQWEVVEEIATLLLELSEALEHKPEFGRYVMGTETGQGYPDWRLFGGGSNDRLVGTPYSGGDLPIQTPEDAAALVHTHPYGVTREGEGRIRSSLEPTFADQWNAMLRGVAVFTANRDGMRVVLPNGVIPRKTWPLGGGR